MQTKSAIRAEYTTKLERQVKEITVEAGPISRSEAVFRSSLPNSALYQIQFAASFLPLSISLLLRAFSYASRLGCASGISLVEARIANVYAGDPIRLHPRTIPVHFREALHSQCISELGGLVVPLSGFGEISSCS